MNLDDLILWENENTFLDFKREEYRKGEKQKLIKDIMAMANAPDEQTKYIIIGVEDEPGKERNLIGVESIEDQANIENIIQENIEPHINFKYYLHKLKDKNFGIIEIYGNDNRPYMMKKDFKPLNVGEIWIRKGSRQSRMNREDLDRLISNKKNNIFYGKVKLGFGKKLESTFSFIVPKIDKGNIPSEVKKRFYEEKLLKLRKYIANENITGLKKKIGFDNLFAEYDSNSKSIKIGNNELGIPNRLNEEEILKRIENIKKNYYEEDKYFYFEKISLKINFNILNDSTEFLEDVLIKIWFDKSVFLLSQELPEKPHDYSSLLMSTNRILTNTSIGYPNVIKEEERYLVEESFSKLRHKELFKLFTEDLRVLITEDKIGDTYSIPYKISAKNLEEPIEGEIYIKLE